LLRYELSRRKRWLGLGSVETFLLEEASQRSLRARALPADKLDPLKARRAERARSKPPSPLALRPLLRQTEYLMPR
jgi:hypothetical protein